MMFETTVSDYIGVRELRRTYFDRLSVHGRGELFAGIAGALWAMSGRDDARACLRRIVSELPGSPYALTARRLLDDPETAERNVDPDRTKRRR